MQTNPSNRQSTATAIFAGGSPIYQTCDIKPYSTRELARIYGVSANTFRSWLVPFRTNIGLRTGRFYSVKQVEFIFSSLGMPYRIGEQD